MENKRQWLSSESFLLFIFSLSTSFRCPALPDSVHTSQGQLIPPMLEGGSVVKPTSLHQGLVQKLSCDSICANKHQGEVCYRLWEKCILPNLGVFRLLLIVGWPRSTVVISHPSSVGSHTHQRENNREPEPQITSTLKSHLLDFQSCKPRAFYI